LLSLTGVTLPSGGGTTPRIVGVVRDKGIGVARGDGKGSASQRLIVKACSILPIFRVELSSVGTLPTIPSLSSVSPPLYMKEIDLETAAHAKAS
jgi:hypothetical protein